MAAKRNTLCLADNMKMIEYAKQNPSAGTRKIAEVFEYDRTHTNDSEKSKINPS